MNIFHFIRFKYRNLTFKLGHRPVRSSLPFISGDTYRLHCEVDLSATDDFAQFTDVPRSVFIASGQISSFLSFVITQPLDLSKSDLYIHNGDGANNYEAITELARHFKTVYAVNWIGEHKKIKPIPIGLENIRFLRNGFPGDFLSIEKKCHNSFQERPIELLVAFSLHTNPVSRSAALRATRGIRGVKTIQTAIKPYEYLNLVSKSKFVLSPPGNGPDCHRTWEAIYLGAVPIVHASAWPFKDFDLPVIVLEDWESLSSAITNFRCPGPISRERLLELFFPLGKGGR
jgi:hypothetical protein